MGLSWVVLCQLGGWSTLVIVVGCKNRYSTTMKALKISDRVLRLEQLALRARVSLDLWIGLHLDTAREPFNNALDSFEDYWRFARSDHEDVFIIRITNLFTQDKRTENFQSLLAAAKKSGEISKDVLVACNAKILALGDLPQRVALIRNMSSAHQHRSIKRNELFSQAKISLNLMTQYSDTALELSSMLLRGIGYEPISQSNIIKPADTLAELLDILEQQQAITSS